MRDLVEIISADLDTALQKQRRQVMDHLRWALMSFHRLSLLFAAAFVGRFTGNDEALRSASVQQKRQC